VKMVFLSRISEKKNLRFVLSLLRGIHGPVEFDIWGPISDPEYWKHCQEAVRLLPPSIRVAFCGPVEHELVPQTLGKYHFFVLATLGENFGHVVPEAWAAGCPVLISDQTPWVGLEAKRLGWDIPLGDETRWRTALQNCVDMDQHTYTALSQACRQFVSGWANSPHLDRENIGLFEKVLHATRGAVASDSRASRAGGLR
jgi:glycosyltransferase involved in cell wall biosynthesis